MGPKPKDELSIFSGRINTVATKASPPAAPLVHYADSGARYPPDVSDDSSPRGVPAEPPVPGFTTLHPTLRDHWTNFDGDLNTQLTNAERDEYYTDADTHMEELPAPDAPQTHPQPYQGRHTEQHRLYPLTIPSSEFHARTPHSDTTTSAVSSGYGSNQGSAPYSSGSSHHHAQTHAYHPYQPDVLQSASSQGSSQEYGYHAADARYDAYGQPAYSHPHPHQHAHPQSHSHPPRDEGQHYYRTPSHAYPADTDPVRRYATPASSSQYALFMSDYQGSPGGQVHRWDDAPRTYADPVGHPGQPLGRYVQYDRYAYTEAAGVAVAEEPLQRQDQHHLQETWQSFGVYVGSPRPTP